MIFDLDGVLVTTDELHFRAWKALAERLGIEGFSRADNARQRGVSRMASLEVVLEKTDRVFSDEEKAELAEEKNRIYVKSLAALVYIGGTHPASAGGAWIAAVNGFAGVSVKNGALVCEPSLPKKWTGMRFKLRFGGRLYRVKISGGKGVVYAEDQDRKG